MQTVSASFKKGVNCSYKNDYRQNMTLARMIVHNLAFHLLNLARINA
jgi:hypothetical protein